MTTSDLRRTVERVASTLTNLGIRFHLTGGLASSFYGEPRTTRDADFVVRLGAREARSLVRDLSRDFLINASSVQEAVRHNGMFQALDQETMIKVDFHVGELIGGELGRSRPQELFGGLVVPLVSKEDAILSKLIWIRDGSDRSRSDVLGMLMDPGECDMSFVRERAAKMGCAGILGTLETNALKQPGTTETDGGPVV